VAYGLTGAAFTLAAWLMQQQRSDYNGVGTDPHRHVLGHVGHPKRRNDEKGGYHLFGVLWL
jgi:hypothetical protein